MAHDFNNSLCGVLGFLELALSRNGLDPTISSYLEMARTCTLDAAQTVRRVQDFARWQRHELSIQLVDLNELVRQTLELTRPKWESLTHARGASITVRVEAEAKEWISASPAELREVLTNLVFNAVDAMSRGGQLTVRTWSTANDLYLSVRDTGVGMTDSTRRRLFEPFFTTKGERGNGLGLSVTFGIIQRYGGEINVDSEPGRGSTFLVRLPLKVPEQERLGESENLAAARTAGGSDGMPSDPTTAKERQRDPCQLRESSRGKTEFPVGAEARCTSSPFSPAGNRLRILVIEDEESVRRFLAEALTQLGHHPRTAADAREGLAAFAAERFDLVFTDLGLPDMSGEEVARCFARNSPATPIILLTGWSSQLKDEAQPLTGVTHVLGKPITLDALSSALKVVASAKVDRSINAGNAGRR
jgi:CheY-like chemotaxis protein